MSSPHRSSLRTAHRAGARLAALAAALLAGCGVQGRWELARVDPVAARTQVEYLAFTLQDDGTFVAQGLQGAARESGTYTFADGVLTLVSDDGMRRAYEAQLVGGDEMCIEPLPPTGQLVRATFVRGQ